MKKPYSKPQIIFESFLLSTNLAGDCELRTTLPSKDMCAYNAGSDRNPTYIFTTEGMGCVYLYPDGVYDGYCYHNPTDNNNLFNS